MMDIDSIRSLDRAEMAILHPVTGEETGAFVTLASPDHPARRRAVAEASRRLRAAGEQQDIDLLEEMTAESVIGSVLGWRGIRMAGAEVEYTAAAARDLLVRPELKWLVLQLIGQMGRQENFISTSAPV